MIKYSFILFFIFLSGSVSAQSTSTGQLWFDYNYKAFLKANFSVGGDAGFRTDVGDANWNALYIRPKATYRFNHIFEVGAGLGIFQNWNSPALNDTEF